MGSKNNPGQFDCYKNALPDEPMFILLARDPDFARLVRLWADKRLSDINCGERPKEDFDLVREAYHCASNGEKWRKENNGKWRK